MRRLVTPISMVTQSPDTISNVAPAQIRLQYRLNDINRHVYSFLRRDHNHTILYVTLSPLLGAKRG